MTNKPETYCADAVVTKTAPSQEDTPQDVTLGFCNGADTATVGPLGDDALAKIPAGAIVVIRGAVVGLGLHLPRGAAA